MTDLAQRTGLHRNSLSRYMTGRVSVLPASVSRLLDLLDIDAAQVLVRKSSSSTSDPLPVAELLDTLTETFPTAAYVLFGSRARRDFRRYSDFDLGVYSRNGLPFKRYLQLLEYKERFEEESPFFIDLVNLNSADEEFLKTVLPDMKFLAGRQSDWIALRQAAAKAGGD